MLTAKLSLEWEYKGIFAKDIITQDDIERAEAILLAWKRLQWQN